MAQNISGLTATGSYSDASTADITNTAAWSISDSTIASINAANGQITIQSAGKIWGGDVGVTATLAPGTAGTASLLVIASDSGSVAPRMPQQDNHWLALGLSPWGGYAGLQELTGNVVMSGSAGYSMTANAGAGQGVLYGQTVPGWIRTNLVMSGTSATRMGFASGSGPNGAATSIGYLGYVQLGPSAANAPFFGGLGTTTQGRHYLSSLVSSAGAAQLTSPQTNKALTGPISLRLNDRVHPVMVIANRATSELWAYTDGGLAMTSSYLMTTDDVKGMGTFVGSVVASASYHWFAIATGSIVEALTVGTASADFFTKLGWNVTWAACPTDSGGVKAPFLASHWKSLSIQPWTATWNFQDEAGPIETFDRWDNYGMNSWRLAVNLIDQYRYVLPNWARTGIKLTAVADHRAQVSTVFGPPPLFDPSGSFAILSYALVSGSSVIGTGQICGVPTSPASAVAVYGGLHTIGGIVGRAVIYCAGAATTGTLQYTNDRVHPWLLVYDKTNSRVKFYSDMEVITGSFNASSIVPSATASVGFGGINSNLRVACSGVYVFGSFTTGTMAEQLSDDGQASAFLKKLGWNPSW